MNWTEIKIEVSVLDVEEASAIAQLVAGGGIYIEDYSDLEEKTWEIAHIDLIDEELVAKDRTIAIIHVYLAEHQVAEGLSFIGHRLEQSGIKFSLTSQGIKEEDWATAWKTYYHPIELSQKLAICPSWEEYTPKPNQKVICLDPGMAFGTGTHETTRLCLEAMEHSLTEGMSMLDVGTGSGILAICAKLLGSGDTMGVDIDPVAVRVAKENAALNKCDDIDFFCGDLATDINRKFDVICANIVADAILRLSKDLPALMHEKSICVTSGIIDDRKDEVIEGLKEAGLTPLEIFEQNGWVAITCKKA